MSSTNLELSGRDAERMWRDMRQYENAIGRLCVLIGILATIIFLLINILLWNNWYQLLFGFIASASFVSVGMIKFSFWCIEHAEEKGKKKSRPQKDD